MKRFSFIATRRVTFRRPAVLALAAALFTTAAQRIEAAPNLVLWDTRSPLTAAALPEDRSSWKPVPSNLLALEANPAKAGSDPGYYGREYTFKGDAVVENSSITALFSSARGRVTFLHRSGASAKPSENSTPAVFAEFAPVLPRNAPARIRHFEVLRNAFDEVVLKAAFGAEGPAGAEVTFTFGRDEIIEAAPSGQFAGIRLFSPLEYGIVPGFLGDDLIFSAAQHSDAGSLRLPSENIFVGLLRGGNQTFTLTWPNGKQQLSLLLAGDSSGPRRIDAVEFQPEGQSFYLAPAAAAGIWHREPLKPSFMEKDTALEWRRPFPAKWTTQLLEAGIKTGFTFRQSKGEIWRGVPGSYAYPAWFEGDIAHLQLGKKIPPKGEALIYFIEGNDTPAGIRTPVEILKATLGRQAAAPILDLPGRKLRTHHRRKEGEVHRACTCGYTEAIQAVFEAGEETTRKDFIRESLEDMVYFVRRHVERIEDYRRFANDAAAYLKSKESALPQSKAFIEALAETVQRIPQECEVQKENMKSLDHAATLVRQTLALADKKSPDNLKAFMELLTAWRAMGGAQDYVVAQCHTITRKLFQDAGYGLAEQPQAAELSAEIRTRCRAILRNPDGYEIWADY